MIPHPRTLLSPDFAGMFLHDAILRSCERYPAATAIVDTSLPLNHPFRRLLYADYGEIVLSLAHNFVSAGFHPGEVIAIFLHNSWEFAIAYHAASLAGLIPTPLNPNYREREVRYQLADSCAVALITDAPQLFGISLAGLPHLRRVYTTRLHAPGTDPFSDLLATRTNPLPQALEDPRQTIAALPYSSGTTGLPKGVMLTHENLVVNCRQLLVPGELATYTSGDVVIGFLPLYHIYGLNVVLNPTLLTGGTVVLMPRFDIAQCAQIVLEEQITWLNLVPPVMNAICAAAAQGTFPRPGEHRVRGTKSGAAPLAPDLPRRYTELTGIPVRQGYGMTEASPVTHLGYVEADRYRPDSIGPAVAATECRLLREDGSECEAGERGELVMRGPQFMLGYWHDQEATDSVLRDGWYYSGDIATADAQGFFQIVDRRKELIKYKGFPIAPAEIEAVLLEHPAVRDCGVIGKLDDDCGEFPVAFIVLNDTHQAQASSLQADLPGYVAERLIAYKQPREVRFVESIPRNPSGKILRKDLRSQL